MAKKSYLSECLLWPRLLAKVFTVHFFVGHVNAVRQSGHQRKYPNSRDDLGRRPYGHSWLERIDNDKEPVDGYGGERQR